MHTLLKKLLGIALLAIVAVGALPRQAEAQAVVCVNCTNEWTQIADDIQQYTQMVTSFENEVNMYKNLILNTKNLPAAMYDQAIGQIRQFENTLSMKSNVNYLSSPWVFQQKYQSIQNLVNQAPWATNASLYNTYAQHSQEVYDGAQTALQAAQQQSQMMSADQSIMDINGGFLFGAQGRMDSIQAAGVYAQHTAQQLMKLREIQLIQVQQQALQAANDQRQRDVQNAEFTRWAGQPTPVANTALGFGSF